MRAVHSTAVEHERYLGGHVKRAQLLANVDNFYEFDDKFSNTAKSS